MERTDSKIVYQGKLSAVSLERFRYPDGGSSEREIVHHPGAVAMVAYDDECVHLVRQPREAVGEDALLELPAGKLDVEGESPLECAQRELVEEVGIRAGSWEMVKFFYVSPGWADEELHLFAATDLEQVDADPTEGERIEIVRLPLARLEDAIEECEDAKSLVGLLWLRLRLG
jgi:8-oxo-dGTP pyrophosphatase MutT (NUDIX family)